MIFIIVQQINSFKEPVILMFATKVNLNNSFLILDELKNISENRINADSDEIIKNISFGKFEMWEIGYDLDENFVFWTFREDEKFTLYYANFSTHYDAENSRVIPENKLNVVYDYEEHYIFSYDWIHNLLYRTNTVSFPPSNSYL